MGAAAVSAFLLTHARSVLQVAAVRRKERRRRAVLLMLVKVSRARVELLYC